MFTIDETLELIRRRIEYVQITKNWTMLVRSVTIRGMHSTMSIQPNSAPEKQMDLVRRIEEGINNIINDDMITCGSDWDIEKVTIVKDFSYTFTSECGTCGDDLVITLMRVDRESWIDAWNRLPDKLGKEKQ